jgi:hypothetical protein
MVRKRMNGLFNRLSDQSKDSIAREIKSIFDTNSVSVVSCDVAHYCVNIVNCFLGYIDLFS